MRRPSNPNQVEPIDLRGALTTDDLAALTRQTNAAVRKQRQRGQGPPFVRINSRHVLYPLAQFETWQRRLKLNGT